MLDIDALAKAITTGEGLTGYSEVFDLIEKHVNEEVFPLYSIVETIGETYFKGTVIGHYTTLEGHDGCVIQVLDCASAKRVVHVNRNKYLRIA